LAMVNLAMKAFDRQRWAGEIGPLRAWANCRSYQHGDEQRSRDGDGKPDNCGASEHESLLHSAPPSAPLSLKDRGQVCDGLHPIADLTGELAVCVSMTIT